eukprot:1161148-Pelagomonas_calceolata.AAC.6
MPMDDTQEVTGFTGTKGLRLDCKCARAAHGHASRQGKQKKTTEAAKPLTSSKEEGGQVSRQGSTLRGGSGNEQVSRQLKEIHFAPPCACGPTLLSEADGGKQATRLPPERSRISDLKKGTAAPKTLAN